jgi:hypothetical protein
MHIYACNFRESQFYQERNKKDNAEKVPCVGGTLEKIILE